MITSITTYGWNCSPATFLLLVVGDVFDDMDRVWLPDGNRNVDVLFYGYMYFPNHLIGPVNGDFHFPNHFERNLFDNFIRYSPLYLNVLRLIHCVRHLSGHLYLYWVRLRDWHPDFLANGYRNRLRYCHLYVTDYLNRDATDNVLNDLLKLVSCRRGNGTANLYSRSNHSRLTKVGGSRRYRCCWRPGLVQDQTALVVTVATRRTVDRSGSRWKSLSQV